MTIQIISKKTKNLNDKEISIMKNARINEYGKGSSVDFIKEDLKGEFIFVKDNGLFVVLGHTSVSEFKSAFKPLAMGIHTLDKEKKFYTDYFIGRKK